MSTDSTFTTEALTQELKEVEDWGRVAESIGVSESVQDTVESLENAEKQGSFLIAYLVDNHPLYGWEDVIRGVEDEDSDVAPQLTRKYGGGRCVCGEGAEWLSSYTLGQTQH